MGTNFTNGGIKTKQERSKGEAKTKQEPNWNGTGTGTCPRIAKRRGTIYYIIADEPYYSHNIMQIPGISGDDFQGSRQNTICLVREMCCPTTRLLKRAGGWKIHFDKLVSDSKDTADFPDSMS